MVFGHDYMYKVSRENKEDTKFYNH